MGILDPNFRAKIHAFSSDTENALMEGHGGVCTLVLQDIKDNGGLPADAGAPYRIHCGAHLMSQKCEEIDNSFCDFMGYTEIFHQVNALLRQPGGVAALGGLVSTIRKARWTSITNVSDQIAEKAGAARNYLATVENLTTTDAWWLAFGLQNKIFKHVATVMKNLQDRALTLDRQTSIFGEAKDTLTRDFEIGVVSGESGHEIPSASYTLGFDSVELLGRPSSDSSDFMLFMPKSAMDRKVDDLGSFYTDLLKEGGVDDEILAKVKEGAAKAAMQYVVAFASIFCLKDPNNRSIEQLPPLTPSGIRSLNTTSFTAVLSYQKPRLIHLGWTADDIDAVRREFEMLRRSRKLRKVVDRDAVLKFEETWAESGFRLKNYEHLIAFCGTIAAISPNTASVESYFSIAKFFADKQKRALKLDALNGAIVASQRKSLNVLAQKMKSLPVFPRR